MTRAGVQEPSVTIISFGSSPSLTVYVRVVMRPSPFFNGQRVLFNWNHVLQTLQHAGWLPILPGVLNSTVTILSHSHRAALSEAKQHAYLLKDRVAVVFNNCLLLPEEKAMSGHFDQLLSSCLLSNPRINPVGLRGGH